MRRLGLLIAFCWSVCAWAGWEEIATPAALVDINVVDAGVFVLMAGGGTTAYRCPEDGGCAAIVTGPTYGGATVDGAGCLWGVTRGPIVSPTGCGFTGMFSGTLDPVKLRCADGACQMLAVSGATALELFTTVGVNDAQSWARTPTSNALGVQNLSMIGGGPRYSLVLGTGQGPRLVVDGAAPHLAVPALGAAPGGSDGTLFRRRDGRIGILLASTTPLYGTDLTVAANVVDAGWLPTPIAVDSTIGQLGLVTFHEQGGSDAGYGFGMASMRDGGTLIAGPVPNPNAPGMMWVQRSAPTALASSIRTLSCVGRFCVAMPAAGGSVFAYWNRGGFDGARLMASSPVIREGAAVMLSLAPNEGDGDPFWATWRLGFDGGAVTMSLGDGGLLPQVSATLQGLPDPMGPCSRPVDVSVLLSDGYAPHDGVVSVQGGLRYERTTPDPVTVSPPTANTTASGAPVSLSASSTGQCPGAVEWRLAQDAGALVSNGNTAVYTPPTHVCSPTPVPVTILALSSIDGGAAVDAGTAVVSVAPWGPPNAPAFSGSPFTQTSGPPPVMYPFTAGRHVCEGLLGFPGVRAFLLDAGAPPGVIVTVSDAGVSVASLDECAAGTVTPVVAFELAGQTSPPGSFTVNLVPSAPPIGPGSGFTMTFQADAGGAFIYGYFDVDAGCLAQRGLTADVTVTGPIPTFTTPRVSVPNSWNTAVGGACVGGMFAAEARLYEANAVVASETRVFRSSPQLAGVGPLDRTELPVTCAGLDSPLRVGNPPAGMCPIDATEVTWRQLSGPSVRPLARSSSVQVQSVDAGLDGLIGARLVFEITADPGGGPVATATREVTLVPGRFVTLRHSLSPSASNRDDIVTVRIEVENTAPCRVSGVRLREDATGLRLIPGSARADGASLEGGDDLLLGPFDLEANETRVVTWLGKPYQLRAPSVRGQAEVEGYAISEMEAGTPSADRCGCGSGGGVSLLAMLVGVARLSRRRRQVRGTG